VLPLIPLFHLDTSITAEPSALPCLQLAAYPAVVAIAAVLERRATIAAIVASAAIAGDAVEGAGTMSKQVAMLSFCPSCHSNIYSTCSDWLNKIWPGEFML
jgi:hypothetical protein